MNHFFCQARVRARSMLLGGALFGAGCSSAHGPQSADTATSWLRACLDDRDCSDGASCVHHVCTLTCEAERAACAPLGARASCEAGAEAEEAVCDVTCREDRDCRTLGSDYGCRERRCRPTGSVQATQSLTFELTDPNVGAWGFVTPVAVWGEDRWRVAMIQLPSPAESRAESASLAVAEIPESASSPLGEGGELIVTTSVMAKGAADPVAVGRDGAVALLASVTPPGGGLGRWGLDLVSRTGVDASPVDCAQPVMAAPSLRDQEWLILCRKDDATASFGRYDFGAQRWTAAERDVLTDLAARENVSLTVRGRDAVLFRERDREPPEVALAVGAADPDVRSIPALRWQTVDDSAFNPLGAEGLYLGSGVHGDWVMPVFWYDPPITETFTGRYELPKEQELAPIGLRLDSDGRMGAPVRFALASSGTVNMMDIAGLPESGRIAFCYMSSQVDDLDSRGEPRSEFLLSAFEADGTRILGPVLLGTTSGIPFGDCRLAWSDSALLTLWSEDLSGTGNDRRQHGRIFSFR